MFFQRTLKKSSVVDGIGLHTGKPCRLIFRPAPADIGVHLVRMVNGKRASIRVFAENVKATTNATTIGSHEFSVSTVEHCLSTLAALRIDNAFIEIDGPEIPIVDGSSANFLEAILASGVVEQDQSRKYIYIKEPIQVIDGEKQAFVLPYNGLRITCTIDFSHPGIGKQTIDLDINEVSFAREIASARTFGFLKDVEKLHSMGLALGGSYDNAIVLDDSRVLNQSGLRFADEFVRHKVLDALGDLVTLGAPLMGHLILYKAGHDLLNQLVRRILMLPERTAPFEMAEAIPIDDFGHLPWQIS
ncbi:MAG: UDP-3-O-[3-hydroxymyristoyl] N-acetylglucosamine deacetylase [Pseudomonadota bacterium]|jgi:UDP-3-O-[3-hydroxymyristoyl] N-acetylglucosamine deacetylase